MAQLAKVTRTSVCMTLLLWIASCETTTSDENSIELDYQDYDDRKVDVEITENGQDESRRAYGVTNFTAEEDSADAHTFVLRVMSADDAEKGDIWFKCAVFDSDDAVGLVFEITDDEEQLVPSVNEVLYKFDGVGWEDGGYRPVELEMRQDAGEGYWATTDWTASVMQQFFESDVLWIKYQNRSSSKDHTVRQFNLFMGDAKELVNAGLTAKYTMLLKRSFILTNFRRMAREIKRSELLGEYDPTVQEIWQNFAVLGIDMSLTAPDEVNYFDTYARKRGIEVNDTTQSDWQRNVHEPTYIDAYRDFSLDTTVEELLDVMYADVGGSEAATAALMEDSREIQENPEILSEPIKNFYLKGYISWPYLFQRQMRNPDRIEAAKHSIDNAFAALPEACERTFK